MKCLNIHQNSNVAFLVILCDKKVTHLPEIPNSRIIFVMPTSKQPNKTS